VKTRGQKIEKYLYDYFRDNCSTRVRDGHRPRGGRPGPAGRPAASGHDFSSGRASHDCGFFSRVPRPRLGLGRPTDAPITLWDEAFLPERMRDLLREVRIPGETGERPLVKSERTLFAAHRPPKRTGLPTGRSTSWPPAWLWAPSWQGLAAWPATIRPRGWDWALLAACWDSSSACWGSSCFPFGCSPTTRLPMPMQTFSCSRPGRSYSPATESERRWDGRPPCATRSGWWLLPPASLPSVSLPRPSRECRKITWCSSPFCCPCGLAWPWAFVGDAAELAFDQLRHDDFVGSHGDFVGKRVHIHANIVYSRRGGGPRCGFHGWAWLLACA